MAEKRVVYLTFSTVSGKSTSVTISAPRAGITLQDAKTAANALVANKVILGAGDAELAAFTTAREVKPQNSESVSFTHPALSRKRDGEKCVYDVECKRQMKRV